MTGERLHIASEVVEVTGPDTAPAGTGPPVAATPTTTPLASELAGGPWARFKAWSTAGTPMFPLGVLFGLNMVDELDRAAFAVLLPEIRDHFGLDLQGILTVQSLAVVAALLLAVPVGLYSDRLRRTRIAAAGASAWGLFSVLTAAAPNVATLGVARAGTGLGRMVNEPVHNSLLADYYDIPVRPRIYALHRAASPAGMIVGPAAAGLLGYLFGWRVPFVVFAVVTAIFVVLALRLREPVRGRFERKAVGASEEVADTEEASASWVESFRILWGVRTMRRVYFGVPFMALLLVGYGALSALFFEEVFGLDERARGALGVTAAVGQLAGLFVGGSVASKLMARDKGLVFRFVGLVTAGISGTLVVLALAPNLVVAVAANFVIAVASHILIPGVYAVMSLAMPPNVRSFGFAVIWLWAVPGLLFVPVIGAVGDLHGIRAGLLTAVPVVLAFGLTMSSASKFVDRDLDNMWRSAAARSEEVHRGHTEVDGIQEV